jgi:hypothetical protein
MEREVVGDTLPPHFYYILIFQWIQQESSYPIQKLTEPILKPLRTFFISPSSPSASFTFAQEVHREEALPYYPVICLSASRFVQETDGVDHLNREEGWSYVQGSGDDHEAWSQVGVHNIHSGVTYMI